TTGRLCDFRRKAKSTQSRSKFTSNTRTIWPSVSGALSTAPTRVEPSHLTHVDEGSSRMPTKVRAFPQETWPGMLPTPACPVILRLCLLAGTGCRRVANDLITKGWKDEPGETAYPGPPSHSRHNNAPNSACRRKLTMAA